MNVNISLEEQKAPYRGIDQAERVTWRILKDWVEAQLAMIEAEQATALQVFLPYAQHPGSGKTLYQIVADGGIGGLLTYDGDTP